MNASEEIVDVIFLLKINSLNSRIIELINLKPTVLKVSCWFWMAADFGSFQLQAKRQDNFSQSGVLLSAMRLDVFI